MRSPTRVGAPHQSASFQLRDEVVAPLAVHDVGDGLGHAGRQRAQRVAVEVDDPGRQAEPTAQVGGGVGGVELAGPLGQR